MIKLKGVNKISMRHTSISVLEYKKRSPVVILMRSALFAICSILCHVKLFITCITIQQIK